MSKNKLVFEEKNYKMKKEYNADKLLVGNLETITSYGINEEGPMIKITQQKYIFELRKDGKYREIFTGFLADKVDNAENGISFKYFDLPYVNNIEQFTKYFPEYKGVKIPKLAFITIMDELNFSNDKEKTK